MPWQYEYHTHYTAAILEASIGKVLKTLIQSHYELKPKQNHYACLEVDGFWTFVGLKKNRKRLIYAYGRNNGEIVDYD